MKMKYVNIRETIKSCPDAQYYLLIGERSNGKTYTTLDYCLERYFQYGEEFIYIRRFDEDLKQNRGKQVFKNLINNKVIEKYSKGKWNSILYFGKMFFLQKIDINNPNKVVTSDTPIGYALSLMAEEHDKSTAYPKVKNIFFEEFISRKSYLPDEFTIFMNTLSTIIRLRDDIKIFMCGNTLNKYSPYYQEMGLTNVKNMTQGTREIYTYTGTKLKVVVEMTDSPCKDKPSNVYFAFDNPKLNMITGKNGIWEIDIYPHLTKEMKFAPKNVYYTYYVIWDNDTLECNIVKKDDMIFTFVHIKTTPIKDDNTNIVYSVEHSPKPNYKRKITKAHSKVEEKIIWFFQNERVFYQNNEVGEIMRNYINWCKKTPIEY